MSANYESQARLTRRCSRPAPLAASRLAPRAADARAVSQRHAIVNTRKVDRDGAS